MGGDWRRDIDRIRSTVPIRERVVTLFSSPQSSRHFYLGFTVILLTVAVFINLSRGGIIVMLFSLTLFSVLGGYLKKQQQTLVLGLMGGLIIAGVSWFGWQPILDRFDSLLFVGVTTYWMSIVLLGEAAQGAGS